VGETLFPADSNIEPRLLVEIPEKRKQDEYEIFVSQLFQGEEVGRVTWHLVPSRQGGAPRNAQLQSKGGEK